VGWWRPALVVMACGGVLSGCAVDSADTPPTAVEIATPPPAPSPVPLTTLSPGDQPSPAVKSSPAAKPASPPHPVDVCARPTGRGPTQVTVAMTRISGTSGRGQGELRLSGDGAMDGYLYGCDLALTDRRYYAMALTGGCDLRTDGAGGTNEYHVRWAERSDGVIDPYMSMLSDYRTQYVHGDVPGVTAFPSRLYLTIWDSVGSRRELLCAQMTN
jgi:hypothetical protein